MHRKRRIRISLRKQQIVPIFPFPIEVVRNVSGNTINTLLSIIPFFPNIFEDISVCFSIFLFFPIYFLVFSFLNVFFVAFCILYILSIFAVSYRITRCFSFAFRSFFSFLLDVLLRVTFVGLSSAPVIIYLTSLGLQ